MVLIKEKRSSSFSLFLLRNAVKNGMYVDEGLFQMISNLFNH